MPVSCRGLLSYVIAWCFSALVNAQWRHFRCPGSSPGVMTHKGGFDGPRFETRSHGFAGFLRHPGSSSPTAASTKGAQTQEFVTPWLFRITPQGVTPFELPTTQPGACRLNGPLRPLQEIPLVAKGPRLLPTSPRAGQARRGAWRVDGRNRRTRTDARRRRDSSSPGGSVDRHCPPLARR